MNLTKMKKVSNYLTALLLVILFVPAQLLASPTVNEIVVPVSTTSESVKIEARLNEIKNMDKSKLSSAERKELRREVRGIKEAAKTNGSGVYISVGAIIIILLLLIILL
jgi:hypothetical protein